MRPFLSFLIIATTSTFVLSCNDSGANPTEGSYLWQVGTVRLQFSSPPPEITQVIATLSREGHATRTIQMAIVDTNSASGSFGEVQIGEWHLRVEALDSTSTVRYAGETSVAVLPGQTSIVNLQLLPATGDIIINVTWGPQPTPTAGLVAHYPFNGNAQDASGNGNHGVVHGATPTMNRHGNANSAYWFDGIDDKIEIPSSSSLNPINQLTITLWVRADSITENKSPIIHKGGPRQLDPWLANREYYIHMKRHIVPIYYFEGHSAGNGLGQHGVIDSRGASTSQWVFIALVVDRVNHVMRIYNNSLLTGQVSDLYSTFNSNNYPITLGMEAETGWPDHAPFRGALDEVRIYTRSLTAGEIQTLYELN